MTIKRQHEEIIVVMKLFSILIVVVVTQIYIWFKIHRIVYQRKNSILIYDHLKRKVI